MHNDKDPATSDQVLADYAANKNPDVNQDHFLESLHNLTPKTNSAFESFWTRLEELKDNKALSEQLYGENSDPTSKAQFEEDMADLRKLQESPWGHVAAFLDEKIQQNPAIKKWTEEVVEQILHAFDKSNENK